MFCTVDNCDRYATAKRMCTVHWQRDRDFPGDLEKLNAPIRRYESGSSCTVTDCLNVHDAKGLCMMHRSRLRRTGSLELQPRAPKVKAVKICGDPECEAPAKARGLCTTHLQRPTCSVRSCKRRAVAKHGLCALHRSIQQGTAKGCTAVMDGISCVRLQHAKGLCAMHGTQMRERGEILSILPASGRELNALAPLDRFGGHLVGDTATGCWVWTRKCDKEGYGQFSVGGVTVRAHRWLWKQLVDVDLPDDVELDHVGTAGVTCQPACCRPGHLQPISRGEHGAMTRERARVLAGGSVEAFYPANSHRSIHELLFGEEHRLPTALHS